MKHFSWLAAALIAGCGFGDNNVTRTTPDAGGHLPGPEDLMYYADANTLVFTTFEMKGITTLYWLKAGTDLAKYDNLPK